MYKVAQCWDDGVVTDIIVADLCRKYNAKATFNLNPGLNARDARIFGWEYDGFRVIRLALSEMPSVYDGFQLASHTMHHLDAGAVTPDEFRRDAADARKYIEDIWQREAPGFAWPYGGYNDACIAALREEGFIYGRTVENASDILAGGEPLALPSHCHFLNPDIGVIREAAKKTGCFYFWGHSYEMKDDPALAKRYEDLLAAIADDPEAEWADVAELVS